MNLSTSFAIVSVHQRTGWKLVMNIRKMTADLLLVKWRVDVSVGVTAVSDIRVVGAWNQWPQVQCHQGNTIYQTENIVTILNMWWAYILIIFSIILSFRVKSHLKLQNGPDHTTVGAPETVQQGLSQIGQEMHQARQKGVPEDCNCHSYWFCIDGFHWILREVDPHSHQQHHRWSIIDFSYIHWFNYHYI